MLDIGKRYKKTEVEVRDALAAINFAKRITVATKIESSVEQQLDAYWREQDAAADKAKETAAPKPQLNRTIGRTEVSARPRCIVKLPPPTPKPEPAAMMTDKPQSTSDDIDENDVLRNLGHASWVKKNKKAPRTREKWCEHCKKMSYRDKKLAELQAKVFKENEGKNQEPYKCPRNKGFHLRTIRRRR